ncbi:hypothetical protein, partial [Bifidobacterium pseudolongum]|uniref:hypothetical protein n=1 Tax=Bifidobacterium pseudolongum TaxID=1694 RepID=UPI001C57406A
GLLFSCSCTCNYARYLPFRNLIQPMFTNSSFCSLNYLTAHRNVSFCVQNPSKMFIQTRYTALHGVSLIPVPAKQPPARTAIRAHPQQTTFHHTTHPPSTGQAFSRHLATDAVHERNGYDWPDGKPHAAEKEGKKE